MDKQEYKAIIEEMKSYMAAGKNEQAVELAKAINWRKVHNVNSLVDAADAFESIGKIDEAMELLKLAHERSPIGRTIIYKLAMLCLKKNDIDEARRYLEKFVEIAPKDSHKYILKYYILKAGNAPDEAIIKVLEQLKEADFMEEWGYELAVLYRKNGMIEECVSVCDDLILWFGEGPYVESALELKMIYTPLDKAQEDKYRHFKQKRDGITEIMANEELASGEIISHTVTIPSIELPQETFNTVNLQAEIKKNIDEIMRATEAGEVNENMVAIMNLVEEIPYLRSGAPEEEEPQAKIEKPSINEVFKDYLKEEYTGQMSLMVPGEEEIPGEQPEGEFGVAGQMTIEEVLSEWEKTRHAAELALEDAKKAELEEVKAKALKEANFVLNKLEEAIPKLDAGVTANELLKEEYLSSTGNVVTRVDLTDSSKESFSIPVLTAEGNITGGVNIPVVHAGEEKGRILSDNTDEKSITKAKNLSNTTSWAPPVLENDVSTEEASELLADVNKILQESIDMASNAVLPDSAKPEEKISNNIVRATTEAETLSAPTGLTAQLDTVEIARIMSETMAAKTEKMIEETKASVQEEVAEEKPVEVIEVIKEIIEDNNEEQEEEPKEEVVVPEVPEEPALEVPVIETPVIEVPVNEASVNEASVIEESAVVESVFEKQVIEESVISEPITEEPVAAPTVEENVTESDDRTEVKLNAQDHKIFTYFMQIKGMDEKIEEVLSGTVSSVFANSISNKGNIIITGNKGTGKTKLATSFVKSIQKHTEQIDGPIGKIDGERLNDKDLVDLFSKISGGTLIVENASGMNRETAASLSLSMNQVKKQTLVILEDTEEGVNKVLLLEPSFVKKFTEKITIPVFTIDELVEFGKTYAADKNCVIDEMAVLALYNRINMIGTYDHPTSITEVSEIMEQAIEKSSAGGLFKKKPKLDKDGKRIIREKDFEE